MPFAPANSVSKGNKHTTNDQRKMPKPASKSVRNTKKAMKSNIAEINTRHRGGASASADDDDSNESDEGSGTAIDNNEELDTPDAFALSGVHAAREAATSRLTGHKLNTKQILSKERSPLPAEPTDSDDDEDEDENDDNDDDYADVENISDSEESIVDSNENNVLRSAEMDLIQEFERTEIPRNATSMTNDMDEMNLTDEPDHTLRFSLESEDSQPNLGFDLDLDFFEDPFRGLSSHDTLYQEMVADAEDAFDDDLNRWRRPQMSKGREDDAPLSTQKKVRFEATPSHASNESSDDDPRDSYPDLFDGIDDALLKKQSLMRNFEMEMQQDGDSTFDFDFEDEYERTAFKIDAESDSNDEMSDSDSEDDGDTTDEETVDEQMARMREILKANGKPASSVSSSSPSTPVAGNRRQVSNTKRTNTSNRSTNGKSGRRPKSGTFVHDPTRATVSADVTGSGVKLVCPSKPTEQERAYWDRARKVIGSRDGSPKGELSWTRPTPRTASIPQRPFTAKSTLGTMFDGNLDFLRNNDVAGIADNILQSVGMGRTHAPFSSTMLTEDEATEDENHVNLADFLKMDRSDSEMEDLPSSGITSPIQQGFARDLSYMSPPKQRRDSTGAGLLDHLEQQSGLVSSFRNNQHRAKQIGSLASHPAKRAQTSAQNALQQGRRGAANTPISPARKKWPSQDLDLTGAGVKKAGIGPLSSKHRRSRGSSLSGIHQTLALDRFASDQ